MPSISGLLKLGGALVLVLVSVYFAPIAVARIVLVSESGLTQDGPLSIVIGYVVLPILGLVLATVLPAVGALLVRSAVRNSTVSRTGSAIF